MKIPRISPGLRAKIMAGTRSLGSSCAHPQLEARARSKRRGGFTLVEITMAIGVISFAFVAMLGLLPAGLNTFRSAMDASVSGQIFQRISNDAQQTDFDVLVANPEEHGSRHFDDQGNDLTVLDAQGRDITSPAEKAKAIYHVKIRVTPATDVPGTDVKNPDLATVTVQIANSPGTYELDAKIKETDANSPMFGLWKMNSGIAVSTQSTMVSRNTSKK